MYDVQFKHGYVFDAEAGTFHSQDLFVQNGTIVVPKESSPQAKTVVDAQGKYVLPGLIDEHLHLEQMEIHYASQTELLPRAMAEPAERPISRSSITATSSDMRHTFTPI